MLLRNYVNRHDKKFHVDHFHKFLGKLTYFSVFL